VYINATVPRSRGRIVPLSIAVPNPRPEEVAAALRDMGLEAEYVEARYPALWFDQRGLGYFLVKTDEPVRRLAAEVAKRVRDARQRVNRA